MTLAHLLAGILATLIVATVAGQVLRYTARSENSRATAANINLRIVAWWGLCGSMGLALLLGEPFVLPLFALFSLVALREFLALPPANLSFWLLALCVPLQYWFIWNRWPCAFAAILPVGGLLFVALRQTSKSYWALILCVYCLSHAPALLALATPALLLYLLIVVESCDVLQYVWGKLLGRHLLAPRLSPNKTWEGLIGGVATTTALGAALHSATPFSAPQAAAVTLAVTLAGFAGGLTFSAVKRRAGVKDFGTLLPGHGGVLDRIDSLCFSAPLFYYLVRYCVAA